MARQKKKANVFSVMLDLIDVVDTAVERVTGKDIASWTRYFQEQSKIEAERSERSIPKSTTASADPYAVLGLPPTASLEEVKKRYRKLTMIYHPDREGGYTEAMKRVNEAYEQITKEKEGVARHES